MLVIEQLCTAGVQEVTLSAGQGETVAILGPARSGKTALLRALAGFEPITSGRMLYDGEPITTLPAGRRPTAFVASEDSTFPHLTVFENVAYGLRLRHEAEDILRERVEDLLGKAGLNAVQSRPAHELNDEGRWRVALARAVAIEPKILLVDEPAGDPAIGLTLARSLAARIEAALVVATGDRLAALSAGDKVAFLRNGRIEQLDTPADLYYRPLTPHVADYVSRANLIDCTVESIGSGVILVSVFGKRLGIPVDRRWTWAPFDHGDRVLLVARPETMRIMVDGDGFPATVKHAAFLGAQVAYELDVEGHSISVLDSEARTGRLFTVGSEARLGLVQETLGLLPYPSGA